jgi:hypothetical protein
MMQQEQNGKTRDKKKQYAELTCDTQLSSCTSGLLVQTPPLPVVDS